MSLAIDVNPFAVGVSMKRVKEQLMLENIPNYPPFNGNIDKNLRFTKRIIYRDKALDIGYGDLFSVSVSSNEKLLLLDYIMSKEIPTNDPGHPLLSATYGAGFRVALFIREMEGTAKLNISKLAAQAELGLMEVSIDIKRIGMPKSTVNIPASLMGFEEFGQDQLTDLNTVTDQLENYAINAPNSDFDPSIIFVTPKRSLGQIRILEAKSVLYAMERLKDKETLAKAVEKVGNYNSDEIDDTIVRHVYAFVFNNHKMLIPGDPSETKEVTNDQKNNAVKYLNRYN